MSKEHLYIADSGVEPSPITPAQQAYFTWQYKVGSLEYAAQHGSKGEAQALLQEASQLYQAYRVLRDGPSLSYPIIAGGAPDLDDSRYLRERPLQPNELPPEMADFLKDQEYACLLWGTDQGSVFVVKAYQRDIQSLRGNVPVRILHQLYDHPQAPVIRSVITWYDRSASPLALEAFINVDDPQQRADFLDLAQRDQLSFLFYDAGLQHRLSKVVRNSDREIISQITASADQLAAQIPAAQRKFDAAKADIMRRTSL